ncbi:MAG: TonB family protein [Acidobacteria bacterium]|nr:TonB family protein [Acidobacteriota bacterium]
MNTLFWLHNLAAWCLQITLLVLVGALLPLCLRLRAARARLACWQLLLAGCLLLPALQPWEPPALTSTATVSLGIATTAASRPPAGSWLPSAPEMMLLLLGAGILTRAVWLALGFWRLSRYRRQATLLSPVPEAVESRQAQLGVWPQVYISAGIAGPVTFGIRDAVILLPRRFLEMPPSAQDAIACHELLHVRRRDWAFMVLEECVRAVFWFHPAIWWLLGQIQLAREQAVDHEVVRLTSAREPYLDALLSIAAAKAQPDLAPAPLFLRKRHLARRVASILKEVSMSRRQVAFALFSAFAILILAGRVAVWGFPLQAPLPDERYVTVDTSGASLLHRSPIEYPREARLKKIQGQVVLEVSIDQAGLVSDARVISGPEELRRAALQSALQWHYNTKEMSLPAKTQVTLQFRLPELDPMAQAEVRGRAAILPRSEPLPPGAQMPAPPPPRPMPRKEMGVLKRVEIEGLPQTARQDLLNRLPVREGDPVTPEAIARIKQVVAETDEHLVMGLAQLEGGTVLRISLRDQGPVAVRVSPLGPAAALAPSPARIRVGVNVQALNLVERPMPVYPPLAKQARIQGTVRLNAVIGRDGRVQSLEVESGQRY